MDTSILLHLIIWPTLFGFIINGLFGARLPRGLVGLIACAGPLLGFIATLIIYAGQPLLEPIRFTYYNWFTIGLGNQVNSGI